MPNSQSTTETNVVEGLLAAESARYLRKLDRADADLERYRTRMNAAADKRATIPSTVGTIHTPGTSIGEDGGMDVLTNSPVNTTTNNYPPPVVVATPAWIWPLVVGMVCLTLGLPALNLSGCGRQNPPPNPPAQQGDLHIQVTPGG